MLWSTPLLQWSLLLHLMLAVEKAGATAFLTACQCALVDAVSRLEWPLPLRTRSKTFTMSDF